jgi:hypothetical protein
MPRRPRPAVTSRSEHWLRVAVNQRQPLLNELVFRKFAWPASDELEWFSPIAADSYAEYYDESALNLLGISELRKSLDNFWPRGGPRWDGLARSRQGRILLVEAKAYIEEGVDFRSSAAPSPLRKIKRSLQRTKQAFQANKLAPWDKPFYQYANRLAHLHFLNGINRIDAYLLFLYFADAPDVPRPCSAAEWRGAERLTRKCLGLGTHPYQDRVGTIILSVPEMLRQ